MPQNQTITARRAKRQESRFLCTIQAMGQTARGRVINLSDSGLCILMFDRFTGGPGTRVVIQSPELGRIDGTLRWGRDGKLGIEFSLNSNGLAQISSYFRFFHDKQNKAPERRP